MLLTLTIQWCNLKWCNLTQWWCKWEDSSKVAKDINRKEDKTDSKEDIINKEDKIKEIEEVKRWTWDRWTLSNKICKKWWWWESN